MRRILLGLLTLAFAGFAWLQLNDPDAVAWTVFYGVAAAVSLGAAFRAPVGLPAALLTAVAIGWAGWLYSDEAPDILADGFDDEVVRELGGLGVVTIVMLAILGTGRGVAPGDARI